MNNYCWTITPATNFSTYREKWDQLNQEFYESPLLDAEFVSLALKYFGDGSEVIITAMQNSRPMLMAILVKKNFLSWQTFQPSQSPIGLWMIDPSISMLTAHKLLASKLPGLPLILGTTQLDPELIPRPNAASGLRTLDYIKTAKITAPDNFDDYWASRGKNLRKNLKKQRNKLKREGIETRLEIIDDPDQIESAISVFGKLESAGWKNSKGTAVHLENAQGKFYRNLLESFFSRNQGHIYQYRFNDQVVAMDLCVSGKKSIIILKTTYDENFGNYSPALLMREDLFRLIFDQHLYENIEFYGKVMEWHTRWSDEIRTLYHVDYCRLPILAKFR